MPCLIEYTQILIFTSAFSLLAYIVLVEMCFKKIQPHTGKQLEKGGIF